MELLKQLYCIHSKSKHEEKILEFLINWLFANVKDAEVEIDNLGNLYVRKGISETYPCIVSHVDQVQTIHSDDFQAIETEDIIFGWSSKNKRHEGLGADDKNGVWIALKCLLKFDVLKAAFFVSEEIGCVGSSDADMEFFNDCRFVLQCDRRGYDDLIVEAGLTELCSEDFIKATNHEWFGYKETTGLMTDVMTLKEAGLGVSCLNISCGYYKPHTDEEFTIKYDLLNCLEFVEHIIENVVNVYPHEYVYTPKTTVYGFGYPYGSNYGCYGGYKTYNSGVSNNSAQQSTTQAKTSEKSEEKPQVSGIEKFWEDEYNDYEESDWLSDFNDVDDESKPLVLTEEMRDELYDAIYSLISSCPNASYDMIRSAILNSYPNLDDKDISSLYGEVKYDIKKYFAIPY